MPPAYPAPCLYPPDGRWNVGGRLRRPERVDTPLREPSPSVPDQQTGGLLSRSGLLVFIRLVALEMPVLVVDENLAMRAAA